MSSALEYVSESFPYNLADYTMPLSVRRPLKREGWSKRLEAHPDRYYVNMIIEIIEYGAKIGYQGPSQRILSDNLSSAKNAPDIISRDLEDQVKHNRVTQVDILPVHFISSPLGLVPKPNEQRETRLAQLRLLGICLVDFPLLSTVLYLTQVTGFLANLL